MKILFVGQTWKGSSARSTRESLAMLPGVTMDEIGEDHYKPKSASRLIKLANRILEKNYKAALRREIERKTRAFKPDVFVVYKGALVTRDVVRMVKEQGITTVNIFPDCSPHAHGRDLQQAMGEYGLVLSTKPYHPNAWQSVYGYQNTCICVPHGYDPNVHEWPSLPEAQDMDIVMAASWRPQYEDIMVQLGQRLPSAGLRVTLAGNDWHKCRSRLPAHWQLPGGLYGRSYGETLRRGKIVIAPIHREMTVKGKQQPGDQDTKRSYELASAGCFFLHQQSDYIQTVYNEKTEVPMWESVEDLAQLIEYYLPRDNLRREMAARAHRKAVPNFSIRARAAQMIEHIRASIPG